jgi:hypothetical protein
MSDIRELCRGLSEELRQKRMTATEISSQDSEQDDVDLSHHADFLECRYCGGSFHTRDGLLAHQFNNMHEIYHRRYKGKHQCVLCKDRPSFDTLEDFLHHWYKDSSHTENAAAEFFIPEHHVERTPNGEWLTQPTEAKRMEKRIRWDPRYRMVRWGVGAADTFEDQLDYAPAQKAMTVSETYGPSGSGKSRYVLSMIYKQIIPRSRLKLAQDWMDADVENKLAAEIEYEELKAYGNKTSLEGAAITVMKRTPILGTEPCGVTCSHGCQCGHWLWREPRVFFTFQVAQTIEIVKKVAKPHDNVMQDEDKGLLGKGRDTTIKKLQTVLELSRAKQVYFHFISPREIKYLVNVNLSVYIWQIRLPLSKLITRGIMFDADGDAIGPFQLPVIAEDEIIMSSHEFEKGQICKISEIREEVLRDPERRLSPETVDAILAGEDVPLSVLTIYELYKYNNLEQTLEDGGADSWSFSLDELEEEGKRAAQIIIEKYGEAQAKKFNKDYVKFLMSSKDINIKDFGEYQTGVGERAYFYINLEEEKDPPEEGEVEDADEEPAPTGFSLDDLDYLDIIEREGRVEQKWIDAYRNYKLRKSGWETHREIAKRVGLKSHTSISETHFPQIKGSISQLKGGLFEIEMLKLYAQCGNVDILQPAPRGFKYPDDLAPAGQSDRIVYLLDGTIRICAWKFYDENATVELWRDGHFCPEILKARELIDRGMPQERVKVVVEGNMKGEFFSKEIDPFDDRKSVTIFKRERSQWPPDLNKVLGDNK